MKNCKSTVGIAVSMVLIGLATSSPLLAAPAPISLPLHAMFERTRMVKFNLRNDTGKPLELKVGETPMTVDPGKTIALKLAIGTRVFANSETTNYKSGDVLVEVASQLSDTTIGIR